MLTALSLERVHNVQRGDSLPLGVLGVGDGVTDDTLEEGLEHTAGLLVDHGRDTLDTTTTCETADGGLGDTLDVVAKNLPVALGSTLAEALATFAACDASVCCGGERREGCKTGRRARRVERTMVEVGVLTSSHVEESVCGGLVVGGCRVCSSWRAWSACEMILSERATDARC
jgi:hypothetical protein